MIYKILIIKNRFTNKLNLTKYLVDWFKKYTPFEIQLEEISTDFDVTTQKVSNWQYNGVIVGSDILPKLRTVVPQNKYHSVLFVYGNNLDGIRVSSTNGDGDDPLYPGTEFIQICNVFDLGKTANHELFHAFFYKAHKLQINTAQSLIAARVSGEPLSFIVGGYNAAAEKMRITSTGNVGLGTTSPTAVLHLKASTASANVDNKIDTNKNQVQYLKERL
jgi:hypothetical protein